MEGEEACEEAKDGEGREAEDSASEVVADGEMDATASAAEVGSPWSSFSSGRPPRRNSISCRFFKACTCSGEMCICCPQCAMALVSCFLPLYV